MFDGHETCAECVTRLGVAAVLRKDDTPPIQPALLACRCSRLTIEPRQRSVERFGLQLEIERGVFEAGRGTDMLNRLLDRGELSRRRQSGLLLRIALLKKEIRIRCGQPIELACVV